VEVETLHGGQNAGRDDRFPWLFRTSKRTTNVRNGRFLSFASFGGGISD
jgi:hypothetical protein